MIDVIKEHLAELSGADSQTKWHHAREFLQILVLKIMSDDGLFKGCSFVGGTCLRIIFGVRRFSEDLDFSAREGGMDLENAKQTFAKRFKEYGIDVELKTRTEKTVQIIDLRFPRFLYELGLTPLQDQKLRIKWDIDTRPPEGAQCTVTPLMKYGMMFAVDHHDLPSLFAGKLNACLFRTYLKGRDWYDLAWFLGNGVRPNLTFLNNGAAQTQGRDFDFTMASLKDSMREKMAQMDFKTLRADVERFLDDPQEAGMLKPEYFNTLMEKAWD